MQAVIAFVRGVNVGGNKKLPMAGLKSLILSLGLEHAQTYLQSGNVMFLTDRRDLPQLAAEIETALASQLSVSARVFLRTADELAAALDANPFSLDGRNPSRLLVTFLSAPPTPAAFASVAALRVEGEEIELRGRELYAYYGSGLADSKLANSMTERKLGVAATARNWNTANKVLELARGLLAR
jgi:uncharacterized protein (DUF1697 family)